MQTADILLKLLPFTVKDNKTGVVSFSYHLGIGDWIITSIEIILIIIFLYFVIKLFRSYRRDYKNTHLLCIETEKLNKNGFSYYPEFLDKIKNNKNISHLWNEFDESLIKKDGSIENSLDSAYFFNEHSLASHVGSKLISAIPGILLGIGLLGTFLALYVGLTQLNLGGDPEEMQKSITDFVGIIGIKFTASVWGIFLSVIFTIYEKVLEGKLSEKIKHLQDNIDEVFKRQTAEQNLSLMLTESEQQTMALNSLAETLTHKISEQFNPVITQMNQHLEQMPIHISKAIGESLKEPLQALQQNASSAAETQSESLETIVQSFVEKLDQTTGDQVQGVQTLMGETTEKLTDLIGSIQNISQEQNAVQQEREAKMNTLFNTTMSTFEEQMGQMKNVFTNASIQASSTLHSMAEEQHKKIIEEREAIVAQGSQITNDMQGLLSTLATEATNRDSKVEELMTMISSQHSNLFETNKAFATQMEETVTKIMNTIVLKVADVQSVINTSAEKLSSVPAMLDTFANSSSNLQEFAHTTKDATMQLSETVTIMKNVENSINEQLQTLGNVTQSMNEASSNSVSILANSGEVAEKLQNIYSEIVTDNTENLEEFGNAMSKWLVDYDRQVQTTMQNSLGEVQSALSNFANTLTSSIGTLEDAIESLNEKVQG